MADDHEFAISIKNIHVLIDWPLEDTFGWSTLIPTIEYRYKEWRTWQFNVCFLKKAVQITIWYQVKCSDE